MVNSHYMKTIINGTSTMTPEEECSILSKGDMDGISFILDEAISNSKSSFNHLRCKKMPETMNELTSMLMVSDSFFKFLSNNSSNILLIALSGNGERSFICSKLLFISHKNTQPISFLSSFDGLWVYLLKRKDLFLPLENIFYFIFYNHLENSVLQESLKSFFKENPIKIFISLCVCLCKDNNNNEEGENFSCHLCLDIYDDHHSHSDSTHIIPLLMEMMNIEFFFKLAFLSSSSSSLSILDDVISDKSEEETSLIALIDILLTKPNHLFINNRDILHSLSKKICSAKDPYQWTPCLITLLPLLIDEEDLDDSISFLLNSLNFDILSSLLTTPTPTPTPSHPPCKIEALGSKRMKLLELNLEIIFCYRYLMTIQYEKGPFNFFESVKEIPISLLRLIGKYPCNNIAHSLISSWFKEYFHLLSDYKEDDNLSTEFIPLLIEELVRGKGRENYGHLLLIGEMFINSENHATNTISDLIGCELSKQKISLGLFIDDLAEVDDEDCYDDDFYNDCYDDNNENDCYDDNNDGKFISAYFEELSSIEIPVDGTGFDSVLQIENLSISINVDDDNDIFDMTDEITKTLSQRAFE